MNSKRCLSEVVLKYPHGPAFVIKTSKKNLTLDVFRSDVISLLCFKEWEHFKTQVDFAK